MWTMKITFQYKSFLGLAKDIMIIIYIVIIIIKLF